MNNNMQQATNSQRDHRLAWSRRSHASHIYGPCTLAVYVASLRNTLLHQQWRQAAGNTRYRYVEYT